MNKYYFVARSPTGVKFKSYIHCEDELELKKIMIDHSYQLVKFKQKREGPSFLSIDKVDKKDILALCQKLKMMVKAGIDLSESFKLCADSFSKPKLKNILIDISQEINKGRPLSAILNTYHKDFPEFFRTMMGLAEISGNLIDILDQLIMYYDFEIKLKKKLTSSLFYPILLMCLAIVVVIVVSFVIVPTFVNIFAEMNVEIPKITKALINISEFNRKYFYLVALLLASIGVGLFFLIRTKKGKYLFDKFKMTTPLVKTVPVINLSGRFCRSLKLLVDCGIPIIPALQTTSNLIGNEYVKDRFTFVIDEVKRGSQLSDALYTLNIFPSLFIETLSISEKTASLSSSLKTLAELYEDDSHNKLQKFASIIEPLFIILIALIIIIIIISIFIPMFSMLDNITL